MDHGGDRLGDLPFFLTVAAGALRQAHVVIGRIGADGAAVYTGQRPLPFQIGKVGADAHLGHAEARGKLRHAHLAAVVQKLQNSTPTFLQRQIHAAHRCCCRV